MSAALFNAGDVLRVTPVDETDCEAVKQAGETCRFLRYAHVGDAAIVQFETGKPVYFRPKDLCKEDAS